MKHFLPFWLYGGHSLHDFVSYLFIFCELHVSLSQEAISSYNRELSIWASDMLCKRWNVEPLPIAPELRSPFLAVVGMPNCFGPPTVEVKMEIVRQLAANFNVIAVVDIVDGKLWCRISTQVYNTKEDYTRLADAVEALALDTSPKMYKHI